jgi:hypothetical protein
MRVSSWMSIIPKEMEMMAAYIVITVQDRH